eukprot:scaffold276140_cov31-Tisochrysis_lutea.AAC.5
MGHTLGRGKRTMVVRHKRSWHPRPSLQVLALQESHDDTPALATELIPFRASTLELSVLQQLIHAQSMIAQARPSLGGLHGLLASSPLLLGHEGSPRCLSLP